jgi:hypothetical protein
MMGSATRSRRWSCARKSSSDGAAGAARAGAAAIALAAKISATFKRFISLPANSNG